MLIYYIHGFGSDLNSSTLKLLLEHYPEAIGLTYDHTSPAASIQTLADTLNSDPADKIIIGSSLGGWYAEQLTAKVVADFILYNPQTEPEIGLAKYSVQQSVLFKYKLVGKLYGSMKRAVSRIVILCEDDTTVPYMIAYNKYYGKSSVILTTGGHRMTPENMLFVADAIKSLQLKIQ